MRAYIGCSVSAGIRCYPMHGWRKLASIGPNATRSASWLGASSTNGSPGLPLPLPYIYIYIYELMEAELPLREAPARYTYMQVGAHLIVHGSCSGRF
jgi:hypothetical protein